MFVDLQIYYPKFEPLLFFLIPWAIFISIKKEIKDNFKKVSQTMNLCFTWCLQRIYWTYMIKGINYHPKVVFFFFFWSYLKTRLAPLRDVFTLKKVVKKMELWSAPTNNSSSVLRSTTSKGIKCWRIMSNNSRIFWSQCKWGIILFRCAILIFLLGPIVFY